MQSRPFSTRLADVDGIVCQACPGSPAAAYFNLEVRPVVEGVFESRLKPVRRRERLQSRGERGRIGSKCPVLKQTTRCLENPLYAGALGTDAQSHLSAFDIPHA